MNKFRPGFPFVLLDMSPATPFTSLICRDFFIFHSCISLAVFLLSCMLSHWSICCIHPPVAILDQSHRCSVVGLISSANCINPIGPRTHSFGLLFCCYIHAVGHFDKILSILLVVDFSLDQSGWLLFIPMYYSSHFIPLASNSAALFRPFVGVLVIFHSFYSSFIDQWDE